MAGLLDLASSIKKKFLDASSGVTSFVQNNPTPAGFIAKKIQPGVARVQESFKNPSQYFVLSPQSIKSSFGTVGSWRARPDLPSVSDAIKITMPTVAHDFGNTMRRPFRTIPVLRELGNMAGNTGESIGQGAVDVARGVYDVARGKPLQGAARAAFGAGRILAPATPTFQIANAATQVPAGRVRRFAAGVMRGQTDLPGMAPEVKSEPTKIGPLSVDPFEAAGSFLGFVKNPTWSKIFPLTSKLLNVNPTESKVVNFVLQRITKGGFEGYIQGLTALPDDATPAQKFQILAKNIGIGATSEVTMDALFKGLGYVGDKAKVQNAIVSIMDKFSDEWRKLNVPVATSQLDSQGRRVIIPMWKYMMNDQGGYIKPDEFVPKKIKDILEERKAELGPHVTTSKDAKERLRLLMKYPEELFARGYSREQVDRISATEAKRIIDENIPSFVHPSFERVTSSGSKKSKLIFTKPGEPVPVVKQDVLEAETAAALRGELGAPPPPGETAVGRWIKAKFSPILNLSKDIQSAAKEWDAHKKVSAIDANKVNLGFETEAKKLKIDPQTEWKLVQYSQRPNAETAKTLGLTEQMITEARPLLKQHKDFNDNLFAEARAAGVDVNYLQRHILQSFMESDQQIANVIKAKGLSNIPGFAKHRTIPDYMYAVEQELGLTPRFTTFGQANAMAYEQMQKALANQKFADILTKSGQLLPAQHNPGGWEQITSPFFPKAKVRTSGGSSVEVPYVAPPEMARFLNNIFGGQPQSEGSRVWELAGSAAAKMQDIRLSSPGLTVNSFTIGQTAKDFATGLGDILTGKITRGTKTMSAPVFAMIRGLVPGASEGWERGHEQSIREMAQQNINYSGMFGYKGRQKNVVSNPLTKRIGDAWNTFINEPTFQKFLYQRQVSLFESFRDTLTASGIDYTKAVGLAADQLKNYDGMINELGRSKDMDNILRTFIMAPKYRQGVIGSGVNMVKGLLNFKDPAYSPSRSLMLGLVATFLLTNEVNKRLNDGKNMWENPAGREFELVMPNPTGDNPKHYLSVPWMPSSTAVYRRVGSGIFALIKGDVQEAARQFGGLASIPAQNLIELGTNKNYFGQEIVDPNKPQLPQYAAHVFGGNLPGPIQQGARFATKVMQGKDVNPMVSLAQAFELPIKEGNFGSEYFTVRDEVVKKLDPQAKLAWNLIHPDGNVSPKVDPGLLNSQQKALLYLNNPQLQLLEIEIAKQMNGKTGEAYDPVWDLPADKRNQVFAARTSLPGEKNTVKKTITKQPWYSEFQTQESAFFDALPAKAAVAGAAPQPSEYVQKQMDAKNWKDPQVKAYLDANTAYNNSKRVALGLDPVTFGSSYNPKVKKVTLKIRKFKMPKAKLSFKLKLKAPKTSRRFAQFSMKKDKAPKTVKIGKLTYKPLRMSA